MPQNNCLRHVCEQRAGSSAMALWRRALQTAASASSSAEAELLALHRATPGTLGESRALRALWRHLQSHPALESPCASCDCGEPCGDPLTDWVLAESDAHAATALRRSVAAAFTVHAEALAAAPPPADASDENAETPFAAAAAALLRCAHAYPRACGTEASQRLTFADLGCGVGRPLLTAALLPEYGTALGFENSEALFEAASHAAERLPAVEASPRLWLQRGDAGGSQAAAAWHSADVVLLHAPIHGPLATSAALRARALRPGALLLSVGGVPPSIHSHFQLTERRRLPLSWGMGTLYVSRRLDDASSAGADFGGLSGAHDDSPGCELLRDGAGMQRVCATLRASGAPQQAAEAACVAAFAARSELCARVLVASDVVPALAAMLRGDGGSSPEALHNRASAALALAALAVHPGCAAQMHAALPALVSALSADALPVGVRAAAASTLADLGAADGGADAVRSAGAEAPLRRLAAQEEWGAAAAAAACALEALAPARAHV